MSKPAHMPWVSPYLIVADVDLATDFYQKAFGFQLTDEVMKDEQGVTNHAAMTYQGEVLMFGRAGAFNKTEQPPVQSATPSPISLYLYTDNVDTFYQAALSQGAKSLSEPEDTFWGDRMCRLEDINGYQWSFATVQS